MKKFYMFIAAGMVALSANADLHFIMNGTEVPNGSTQNITSFYEDEDGYSYMVDPKLEVMADEAGAFEGKVTLVEGESVPEFDWDYGAQVNALWCAFDGQCVPLSVGKSATKTYTLTANKAEDMRLEISGAYGDLQNPEDLAIKANCALDFTFGGKNYTLTLIVDKAAAGINDLASDVNAPVEYYDLQGRRVANPSNGLYIMRQGSKVMKSIIK